MPVVSRNAAMRLFLQEAEGPPPRRNLSFCQCVKLGVYSVDRWFNDGAHAWNREHSVHQLSKVWSDGSKDLGQCLAGLWRKLIEQSVKLVKFRGGLR